MYIYLKAHSADPPPCQGVLQSGWPYVVLSHGSANGSFWTSVRKLRAALERTSIHFRSCFERMCALLGARIGWKSARIPACKVGQTHYEQDFVLVILRLF